MRTGEHVGAILFLCNLGNITIYPYLLNKAKITSPKNFTCTVSEQRCAVLMNSSFSVYLGNSCTFFPAFVKSQYQLINRFVTTSSQGVYWSVQFFSMWIEQITAFSRILKTQMSDSYFKIKYFCLSCHSIYLLTAAIVKKITFLLFY